MVRPGAVTETARKVVVVGFSVQPKALDAAGDAMYRIGATVSSANAYVETYVRAGDGGSSYRLIAMEIDGIRADLVNGYDHKGPAAERLYACGTTLKSIAYDYEQSDEGAAADVDALLKQVDVESYYYSGDADLSIDQGALTDLVSESAMDGSFEDYKQWSEIQETTDSILGFKWVGDALGKIGINSPIEALMDELEGDWTSIGYAVGALDQLRSYWSRVASDTSGVRYALADAWKGNAADAAVDWFVSFKEAALDHSSSLLGTCQRVRAETMAISGVVTTIKDAVDEIAGILASPDNLGDGIVDFLKGIAGATLSKLLGVIQIVWAQFKLMYAACQGLVAAFSQLTRLRSLDWPDVPTFDVDVDGPKV